MRPLLSLIALACLHAGNAHALAFTIYADLANWQASAGLTTSEDFSSFATGTSVLGSEVLPGVTLTSNLGDVEIFGAENRAFASGTGAGSRAAGNTYYELNVNNAYQALALDVAAFESAEPPFNVGGGAIGPGLMEVLFEDSFMFSYQLFGNDGGSNVFFGLRADTPITRVRWYEAHEASGVNEETALDNLRVGLAVGQVPEPSTLALAAGGLVVLARKRRR